MSIPAGYEQFIPKDGIVGGISGMPSFTSFPTSLAMPATYRQGILSNTELDIQIIFWKNPEYTTGVSAGDWREAPIQGQANPVVSFSHRPLRTIQFQILLDAHSSPHPKGHIGEDLDMVEMTTMPFGRDKNPLAIPPPRGGVSSRIQSSEVIGVPPIMKLVYGGRVQKGFVTNVSIEELMHGTTPESNAQLLPTRAKVSFDLKLIDDKRMLISI